MWKYLSVIILICAFYTAQAQITITSKDMPSSTDTFRVSYTASLIDVTQTGANYTWNFDTLKSQRQSVIQFKKSSKTLYFFYFLKEYGRKIFDSVGYGTYKFYNIYDFYKNASNGFSTVGVGMTYSSVPLASYYAHPDTIYHFPLKYGNRDSSQYDVNTSLSIFASYRQVGYRISQADGWGSITTPYKKYDSCLRVHAVLHEVDSISLGGLFSFGYPTVREEYKWLAHGEVLPVLEVDGNDVAGAFVPTSVTYRDSFHTSPLAPKVDFVANDSVVTTRDTVSFTNNTSGLLNSYTWTISPSTFNYVKTTTANSAAPSVNFTATGQYTITLKATNTFGTGQKTKTNYITVNAASGIEGTGNQLNGLSIYPNPANQFLYLESLQKGANIIEIYSTDGKLIIQKQTIQNYLTIDLSYLIPGAYVVKVKNGEGEKPGSSLK